METYREKIIKMDQLNWAWLLKKDKLFDNRVVSFPVIWINDYNIILRFYPELLDEPKNKTCWDQTH